MKVYIAGPMAGMPDFNYPAFFDAANALTAMGHDPINPARSEGRSGCKTWLDFMRAAIRDIADADGVAMIPGWQDSRGAAAEYRLGHDLGLAVEPLDVWLTAPASREAGPVIKRRLTPCTNDFCEHDHPRTIEREATR